MKKIIKKIISMTKPFVWRIAIAYDLRVDRPCFAYGQYPLVLEDETLIGNIPKSVYFNTRCGEINIGKNTVFGENVQVLTGKHFNIEEAEKYNKPLQFVPESGRNISIGEGCYIGGGAIIIGPCCIGNYSVIGAGSVVTNDIAAFTFAAGVPAKEIRRFITSKLKDNNVN